MKTHSLLLASAFLAGPFSISAAELSAPQREFLENHCFDCHDTETKKGGLDLEALKFDMQDAASFGTWVMVHDRVRDGEMPPKKKARPPEAETRALLAFLDTSLRSASATEQAREGRALARRLNRDEYQNTLRDLFGVQEDYRPRLPEDGMALGFDKAGSALSVSAEHLQSYMAVARAALDEAIVTGPAPKVVKAMLPQRLDEDVFFKKFHQSINMGKQPDALVRFDSKVARITGFSKGAHRSGMYRFRVRARAWGGETVKARIMAGGQHDAEFAWLVAYAEFPPEGATVELTTYLHPGETLQVSPLGTTLEPGPATLSRLRQKGANPDTYQGPGLAMEWVEVEGPLHDSWPPPGHRRLFGDLNFAKATRADAERVLRGFLPRAFRRPVSDEEVRHYLAIHDAAAKEAGWVGGIKVALQAALCSPHFLYLDAPAGPLDDFALASRLSYFLWSSMPDEELTGLAAKGTFSGEGEKERRGDNGTIRQSDDENPPTSLPLPVSPSLRPSFSRSSTLRQQVERMLNDPKAAAFNESFTGQWLDLRKITATSPDKGLYPEWDELIEWSCVQETRRFFDEVLKHDLSVTHFVQSDFAMLNERLATHYDIPGVKGIEFRKVKLPPDSVRGGVLAQASVLKVTANGTTSSPVLRGVWMQERILGQPVPPPPPGVPAIEPDIRGATTIREQLAKHRSDATCARCHAKIDPPGFALESFDVIGGWRDRYRAVGDKSQEQIQVVRPLAFNILAFLHNPTQRGPVKVRVGLGPAVDASGQMPEGPAFADYMAFRRALLSEPDQLTRALARHLITYATGAGPQYADRVVIEQIVARGREHDHGLRSLIHEIVQSRLFLEK